MGNLISIEGRTFGSLTVIERRGVDSSGKPTWLCKCSCDNTIIASGKRLRNGKTHSCGCYQREIAREVNTKHGLTRKSKLWWVYYGMKARCYNPNNKSYGNYGARGIKVCDEWLGEGGYEKFHNWAMSNGYREGLSIERVDNNGAYSVENCTWQDSYKQAKNRRTQKSNNSGCSGVCFRKDRNDWRVSISSDGKKINLGCYKEYEEAVEARKQAELQYWGWTNLE